METERFHEFCDKHLSHLDEVALEFFGTEVAKGYVRQKVSALFPAHEVHKFTEHFWGMIQFWRKTEADRLNRIKAASEPETAAPEEIVSEPEAEFSAPVSASPSAVTEPAPAAASVATPAATTPTPAVTPTPSKSSQKNAKRARN